MNTLLDTAIAAARAAGVIICEGFGRAHNVRWKGDIDPVTEVDHASETAIFKILREATPTFGFYGEESGHSAGTEEARWIVDPLDGTVNYSHHYPHFGVSIALERAGEVVLGVIYNPMLDELFTVERGQGAKLNGEPIHVSEIDDLGRAAIASGFRYDVWQTGGELKEMAALSLRVQSIRIFGAAVLDMAHVACGRVEAYWDSGVFPWDVAAAKLLIEEAGGVLTFHGGNPDVFESRTIIASNRGIYQQLSQVVLSPS